MTNIGESAEHITANSVNGLPRPDTGSSELLRRVDVDHRTMAPCVNNPLPNPVYSDRMLPRIGPPQLVLILVTILIIWSIYPCGPLSC